MSVALLMTAAVMGLLGSLHCAGMCGAACTAAVSRWGGQRLWLPHVALQFGRALGYALGGALAAGSMAGFKRWSDQVAALQPLWVGLQAVVLALGLWLLIRGQVPYWGAQPNPAWQVIKGPAPAWLRSTGWGRLMALGALWVAWPCGLLQAALMLAALAGSSAQGALVMLSFALSSALGLSWGVVILRGLGSPQSTQRIQGWLMRLSGLMLVMNSGWALVNRVQQAAGFCTTLV